MIKGGKNTQLRFKNEENKMKMNLNVPSAAKTTKEVTDILYITQKAKAIKNY
jgi:hypothetical protein